MFDFWDSVLGAGAMNEGLCFDILTIFLIFTIDFVIFRRAQRGRCGVDALALGLTGCGRLLMRSLTLSSSGNVLLSSAIGLISDIEMTRTGLRSFIRRRRDGSLEIALVGPGNGMVCSGVNGSFHGFSGRTGETRITRTLRSKVKADIRHRSSALGRSCFCITSCFPGDRLIIHATLPCGSSLTGSLRTSRRCV